MNSDSESVQDYIHAVAVVGTEMREHTLLLGKGTTFGNCLVGKSVGGEEVKGNFYFNF